MTWFETWRILLIDDDEDDYLIAQAMLKEGRGGEVQVDWASSFAEGEKLLATFVYDAVLVDYDLGRPNGIQLIQKAVETGYPSPLILFTGRGGLEVDVEAMQAGATLYISKGEATPLLLARSIRYAIDQHATLQALRASEERWRQLAEAMPNMVWSITPEGQCDYLCRRWLEYTGRSLDEQLGQGWMEQLHPDDRLQTAERWREMQAGHQPVQFEFRLRGRDGEYRWFQNRAVPVFVEGRLQKWYGASTDIQDLKQTQLDLERRSRELEAALAGGK